MTRHDAGLPSDRAELKKEIKKEIRHDAIQRRIVGCGSCAVLLVVALAIPTYFLASALAKTGLVSVPVLSERGVDPVKPVRVIVPLVGSDSSQVITAVMAGSKYDPATDRITASFTEQQLTTVVSPLIAEKTVGDGDIRFVSGQVAVKKSSMELYAVLRKDGRDTALLFEFRPVIDKGRIEFETERLVLGEVTVPDVIADAFLSVLTGPLEDGLRDALGGFSTVRGIRMEEGVLHVTVDKP